jgi:hypothetical protein
MVTLKEVMHATVKGMSKVASTAGDVISQMGEAVTQEAHWLGMGSPFSVQQARLKQLLEDATKTEDKEVIKTIKDQLEEVAQQLRQSIEKEKEKQQASTQEEMALLEDAQKMTDHLQDLLK